MITAPPLQALVLFATEPPSPEALRACGAPGGVTAQVRRCDPPAIEVALGDPTQPLSAEERAAAATARSGLLFVCADPLAPLERLRGFAQLLGSVVALDGVAVLLPSAQRIIGRAQLAPLPTSSQTLTQAFVHRHIVRTASRVWCHTHGMEQLGLPDLECEVPVTDVRTALAQLDAAVAQLVAGDLDHARVAGAPQRDDHSYGAFGALCLVFHG